MIKSLPAYISVIFVLTTIATMLLFVMVVSNSNAAATRKKAIPILVALSIWLLIQAVLTVNNVYNTDTNSLPPKIVVFGILPTMMVVFLLFITKKGRQFMDSLPLKNLTYINIVRIPVEVVLWWLSLNKAIPTLMTFEGRNFDIIAGVTAPLIAYLGFTKVTIGRQIILAWNFICLGLLLNIVVNALLSAPSPIQQWAFDQPNIAILHFPFSWLPTFIVPVVLLGHLVSIRQLLKSNQYST
jgi:hypothetical protein